MRNSIDGRQRGGNGHLVIRVKLLHFELSQSNEFCPTPRILIVNNNNDNNSDSITRAPTQTCTCAHLSKAPPRALHLLGVQLVGRARQDLEVRVEPSRRGRVAQQHVAWVDCIWGKTTHVTYTAKAKHTFMIFRTLANRSKKGKNDSAKIERTHNSEEARTQKSE